jgi:transposase
VTFAEDGTAYVGANHLHLRNRNLRFRNLGSETVATSCHDVLLMRRPVGASVTDSCPFAMSYACSNVWTMTQSEARRLRSDEGLSVAQIQRRLGVSKHRMTEWLRGVPPPEWTARPNAKDDLRARATALRGEGWSVNDIAAELGIARSTAWGWVRHLPLDPNNDRARSKREHSKVMTDARWARHRVERDAAKQAVFAQALLDVGALDARDLVLLGAAIYWCEGTKTKPWRPDNKIRFINSDPVLVELFLRFLDLNGIEADQIKYRVAIHETADANAAAAWWAARLGLNLARFYAPNIKRHVSKTVRHNISDDYHGCLVVSVLRGRDVYWRIEGLVAGIARAAGIRCG